MPARSFNLSEDLDDRLTRVASQSGRSPDEIVHMAVTRVLDDIEEQLNEARLERVAERLKEIPLGSDDDALQRIAVNEATSDPLAAITLARRSGARAVPPQQVVVRYGEVRSSSGSQLAKRRSKRLLQRLFGSAHDRPAGPATTTTGQKKD
jgi:predicted transcriptional regulator